MPDVSFENLLVVALVAVLCPLTLGFFPRLRLPSPVLEILVGVVLGPGALGWVHSDLPVQVLAIVGLSFLLFLSGLEIELREMRGAPLRRSLVGYAISLVLGLVVGFTLHAQGTIGDAGLVAVTLTATSLGLVVPVLKDAGRLDSAIGKQVLVASSVADLAAIVLLSLLFSTSTASWGTRVILIAGFVITVGLIAAVAVAARRSTRLGMTLERLQDTTAEIRVRLVILIVVGFVVLAGTFGLETILGAFVAGVLVASLDKDTASHPHLRTKLSAIGFGFLIPVFFVASGIRLDLRGLLASPGSLALVPLFLICILVVRGLAVAPYVSAFPRREVVAAALLQATTLPIIVTATQIGIATGRMSPVTAAALVSAGLLSVLVFPLIAVGQLRNADATTTAAVVP
jgi:Kef-type K+ transport system membrane component KefB